MCGYEVKIRLKLQISSLFFFFLKHSGTVCCQHACVGWKWAWMLGIMVKIPLEETQDLIYGFFTGDDLSFNFVVTHVTCWAVLTQLRVSRFFFFVRKTIYSSWRQCLACFVISYCCFCQCSCVCVFCIAVSAKLPLTSRTRRILLWFCWRKLSCEQANEQWLRGSTSAFNTK